jgi:polysaccharide pyruvyl transferase CsaB
VNLGDELLLSILARWVRDAGAVPVALSVHPGFTRAHAGIEAVSYVDREAIEAELDRAALFVLGGGGLFQDYDRFAPGGLNVFPAAGAAIYAQHAMLARARGVPTVALAQGVGPLRDPTAKAAVRELFSRAHRASVRDPASLALLRELGVPGAIDVAPDPAWTHRVDRALAGDLARRWPSIAGRRRLAIVLRDWPFTPGWERVFAETLPGLLPADWGVVWLDFSRVPPQAEPGGEIGRRMAALMRERDDAEHVVWDGRDADEAAAVIAACDGCLAMRFHAVLLAELAGVPVAAIEYDDKVRALAGVLGLGDALRVPMEAVAARLPGAIAALVGGCARARGSEVSRLAGEALLHRRILVESILEGSARRPRRGPA